MNKYKSVKNLIECLENDNNCIYNYSRKFKESTDNTPVDINNVGFEETKGEEATREAEMNEQYNKKNRWHIKRCNDKGIIIKQRYYYKAQDLADDENWPEIINTDAHHSIFKRPNKKHLKLNITISPLFK